MATSAIPLILEISIVHDQIEHDRKDIPNHYRQEIKHTTREIPARNDAVILHPPEKLGHPTFQTYEQSAQ